MMHRAQFPAVHTSAHSARRFVSTAVVNVPDEVGETIALIASELATNSVRHAASAFEIRVEQLPDRILIEVEDDGEGDPVVRAPKPTDTSGRGLQIVQALADQWGVLAKAEPPGKTVWASIALSTPEGRAERASAERANEQRRPRTPRGTGPGGSGQFHSIDEGHRGSLCQVSSAHHQEPWRGRCGHWVVRSKSPLSVRSKVHERAPRCVDVIEPVAPASAVTSTHRR
jgi:anti-sigma regulatory factor (Ser/Thr protein kinase)